MLVKLPQEQQLRQIVGPRVGAKNLGTAMGFGQIAFALTLVFLLVKR